MRSRTTILSLVLLLTVTCSSTKLDYWFRLYYEQLDFFVPIATLIFQSNNDQLNISFVFDSHKKIVTIDIRHRNKTNLIELKTERAGYFDQYQSQWMFIAFRENSIFETYINCKKIDSATYPIDSNKEVSIKTIYDDSTTHYSQFNSNNRTALKQFFTEIDCQPKSYTLVNPEETTVDRTLIKKMQDVISLVQQNNKQENDEHSNSSSTIDSLTIVFKINVDSLQRTNKNLSRIIFDDPQFNFRIEYIQNQSLVKINFNNGVDERFEWILYATKLLDISANVNMSRPIFLHLTPFEASIYVGCERTDLEYPINSSVIKTLIRRIKISNNFTYNRQQTVIIFNKTIDETAQRFRCLSIDKLSLEPLPNELLERKFANSIDVLLSKIKNLNRSCSTTEQSSKVIRGESNISSVKLHEINGYGSLKGVFDRSKKLRIEDLSNLSETIFYGKTCSTNKDCQSERTFMVCQSSACVCTGKVYWSSRNERCLPCHDVLIGNRCFRLSTYKSDWNQSREHCQHNDDTDESLDHSMKLVTDLNPTEIEQLREILSNSSDEHESLLNYIYWIGASSNVETRKTLQIEHRYRRQLKTIDYFWYDNERTARINPTNLWCPNTNQISSFSNFNEHLCVGIASCGLNSESCHRHNRFICEAI